MTRIKWRLFFLLLLSACSSDRGGDLVSPKPRMYPRADLPDHRFVTMDKSEGCGFLFRRSVYSEVVERSRFFDQQLENDCWFDLHYPEMNVTVHFTYHPIREEKDYATLAGESFRMAYEHSSIASSIREEPVFLNGLEQGMIFQLKGPVASPYQFYLTDTTRHFLRGSLYFNSHPNPDSVAPYLHYLSIDMDTLIQSIRWK